MASTFRLTRVAGIEIGAHWSWLLVVVLIVWSLAVGVFPESNPGLSDGAHLAMAIAAALLFFLSITLHELGHALQARREDIPIDGITLWVFGGVARFGGRLPSAAAELRVALAGPVVSLALGAVLLAVALVLELPPAVDGVVFWLGQINLVLLAFNLLPALPLDGGRVLRALLWARKGDFRSATGAAAGLGRAFGQILIGLGVMLVLFVGALSGLWLAFIGWFLLAAAESEARGAAADDALAGLSVSDLMVHEPVTVAADATVQEFMDDVFLRTRHTAFPVLDGGRAVGIASFRQALALPREAWPVTATRDIMVPAAEARITPEAAVADVLGTLTGSHVRRLLVCRDGELEGLLSLTDVTRVVEARAGPDAPRMRMAGPAREAPSR